MGPRGTIKGVEALGTPPFPTLDPWLFCVYHKDAYPPGDDKMQAPALGNGADFDHAKPWRMYHGERVPGFPQHPHRGFETLTATIDGLIDHTDSLGNAGRYGYGDNQWMTAGKGVVHGENFPLVDAAGDNPTKFFQLWLNLPARNKMADPTFVMHWGPDVPKVTSEDGKTRVTVFAGELAGAKGLPPPPASWAAEEANDVGVWHLTMAPGAVFTLPPAKGGGAVNRALYFVEGDRLVGAGKELRSKARLVVEAGEAFELENPSGGDVEVLMLQGKPIQEPVAQHGPFVMNTRDEIMQAFHDYQKTQFGGWPWDQDAVVFPRTKGRFALLNGKETYPPGKDGTAPLVR